MKYIIFAKRNKNHFLFLSYFIIKFIDEIIDKHINTTKDIVHKFHKKYLYSLSDLLTIIPIIIIKVRSKNINKKKLIQENEQENTQGNIKESKNDIEYIYSDMNIQNNKTRAKRILKFSIIVSVFEFLAKYIEIVFGFIFVKNYSTVKKEEQNSNILLSIISKYILSIIILHYPFHKHHYVSMGINLIFLIALITIDIINMVNRSLQYPHMITKTVITILYSFEDVIAKILLSFNSISPYIYLFYRGIIVNFLAILFSIVFIFVKLPDRDDNDYKSCVFTRFWKVYEVKLNILLYVIQFFLEYLINLNIVFIIDKFSPTHFAMTSILSNFSSSIVGLFKKDSQDEDKDKDKLKYFFIKLAIYLILIISCSIYNEFIILNFCSLQKNTKLFLQGEAIDDIQQTDIVNINDNDLFSEDENKKQIELNNVEQNSENDNNRESSLNANNY